MTIENLQRASSSDVSKRFGLYYDEAMTLPLAVQRNRAACVVIAPAVEYDRLARLDHIALHPRELDQAELRMLRDVTIPESAQALDHLLD